MKTPAANSHSNTAKGAQLPSKMLIDLDKTGAMRTQTSLVLLQIAFGENRNMRGFSHSLVPPSLLNRKCHFVDNILGFLYKET